MKAKQANRPQPISRRESKVLPGRTPDRTIKFIKRPALFFAGFASIAIAAALFSAYPKWHKQETENWVYSYVTDHFPGKGVENLQRLAVIIYRESSKIRLEQASDGHKFDKAALLLGVIQTESEFNRKARSPVGARGFMQLMPATAALLKGRRLSAEEIIDAETNITLGVRYLNEMIREMGSVEKALLAYNAGPGAVRRWGGVPAYFDHVVQAHDKFLSYRSEGRNARLVLAQLAE
ncbi:MAG: transglycosylase SLT domain-containing protein [Turneriella sp.]|nr:transglycosylase SLT domain-containing protein [Turneriella sp.]